MTDGKTLNSSASHVILQHDNTLSARISKTLTPFATLQYDNTHVSQDSEKLSIICHSLHENTLPNLLPRILRPAFTVFSHALDSPDTAAFTSSIPSAQGASQKTGF